MGWKSPGGIGIGSDRVNNQTGITTNRIGTGFTDVTFVGTGISITGYGSTVALDFSSLQGGGGGDDAIIYAIALG